MQYNSISNDSILKKNSSQTTNISNLQNNTRTVSS